MATLPPNIAQEFWKHLTPTPSKPKASPFITGSAFAPVSGKCYEVSFEPIEDVENAPNTIRIKANGRLQSQWVILDPDKQFHGTRVVQAYREIPCSDSNGCAVD